MSTSVMSGCCTWLRVLGSAAFLVLASACGENGAHHRDVGQLPSGRLDGAWTLSMRLERPMSLSRPASPLPFTIHGTVMLMTNDDIGVSFATISQPTQIGVYALRLDSLGLALWQNGEMPTVAAREDASPATAVTSRDSILLVLNPSTPTHEIRLSGVVDGDVVRGSWTAESPLGGGGSFELRRRQPLVSAVP